MGNLDSSISPSRMANSSILSCPYPMGFFANVDGHIDDRGSSLRRAEKYQTTYGSRTNSHLEDGIADKPARGEADSA